MQKYSRLFPSVPVSFTGQSLISHAGVSVLTGFMDALGFGRLCEDRLGQFVPAGAKHRPGRLVGSLAAVLAAGGEHASDLDILRSSPAAFGQLPSNATVSRFFERTVANPELFSYGFETLTRELRTRAWNAAGNRNPAASATAADPLIIDIDATLVTSHSDKENVAGTYKGGYGFAPFIASADYGAGNGSGEILACVLRPGSAGANSAEDHIRVFHTAAAQLPESFYDPAGVLAGEKVLVRTDSAGASRKFLWHLHSLGVQFTTSYTLPFGKAHMVDWISDKEYWQPALDQTGNDRTDAWVINATDVIPLTDYPPGTKLFLRAEPLHPGAQPTLVDVDGHRITAFLTNSPRWHAVSGRQAPCPRPVREQDQNPEKHRPGQAAVLRLRCEPGLGEHRSPRLQPGLLAPARSPPGRTPGQGLGHQTLALPALRDCRENHHPRPPHPTSTPGISPGKRPRETAPGQHQPAQSVAFPRLKQVTNPVPTSSSLTGSGTGAKPGEPTGHTRLPENRKQNSDQPRAQNRDRHDAS